MWFPNRSDSNFGFKKKWDCTICVAKNKGADQRNCEADLRLCFRLCRLLVFPCGGSFVIPNEFSNEQFSVYIESFIRIARCVC